MPLEPFRVVFGFIGLIDPHGLIIVRERDALRVARGMPQIAGGLGIGLFPSAGWCFRKEKLAGDEQDCAR